MFDVANKLRLNELKRITRRKRKLPDKNYYIDQIELLRRVANRHVVAKLENIVTHIRPLSKQNRTVTALLQKTGASNHYR